MSAKPEAYTSKYLSGTYEPVFEEVVAEDLEVVGEIPKDLSGHFLRIGPNPYLCLTWSATTFLTVTG
jgi:carotenoid cleavage dioxygenase-like enzyme